MKMDHVEGKKRGEVVLYALSTCVWCKKTRALLGELGVDYFYTYVDLLSDADKDRAEKEITKWNPSSSFPTLVIDNKECIIGYNPEEIRKRLGK